MRDLIPGPRRPNSLSFLDLSVADLAGDASQTSLPQGLAAPMLLVVLSESPWLSTAWEGGRSSPVSFDL